MSETIYLTLASDDNYAQHMGMVMLSVLSNASRADSLHFFILDAGIASENRARLEQIAKTHGAGCEFIQPDSAIYGAIPTKRYGVAALFRLSIGTILPADVERVIYLDCDVLAFDDIQKLWLSPLEGKVIGAVTNLGHQPKGRLDIPDGEYFNSGVLLIDLQRWRQEGIGEKTLDFMQQNTERLIFPDQDGLNCILKDKWQHLALRWNQQPASYSMYKKGRTERSLPAEEFEEAVRAPGIVHYLGRNKPWDYMTFHPLKENYWAYMAKSPWPATVPKDRSLPNILKKSLMLEKNIKHTLRRLASPPSVRNRGF